MITHNTVIGAHAMLICLLACGAACSGDKPAGESSSQRPQAKTPDAPRTAPEPPTEEEIVRALVATVTPAQRAEYEAREAAIQAQYDAHRHERSYETLFEVPVIRENGLCEEGPCMRTRVLYYGVPEEWGLGAIQVDRSSNIWIADGASSRWLQLDRSGKLLSVRKDRGDGMGLPPDGWSDLSQLAPTYRTQWNGKRYVVDCGPKGERRATIVIGDAAYPFHCMSLRQIGPHGDFYAGSSHYDEKARLLGYAVSPDHERDVLIEGRNDGLGPAGKMYAYIARKNSVRFVEVPFYPQ